MVEALLDGDVRIACKSDNRCFTDSQGGKESRAS